VNISDLGLNHILLVKVELHIIRNRNKNEWKI